MAGQLIEAVRAFCEAPANPSLAERLALARASDRLEGWLQNWPPGWKDFAGDAWQVMHKAIHAEGDQRRAQAGVLQVYFEKLEAGRRAAGRPTTRRATGPRSEPPKNAWWMKD